MSVLLFVHTGTVLVIWRNNLNLPFTLFFWTGTFDSAFMTTISFTTFVLTLDKCVVLLMKEKYGRFSTIIIFCTSILINTSVAGVNLTLSISFHESTKPEGCILLKNAQMAYSYSKTAGVIMNAIVGILFLIITAWIKKTKPEIGSKMKTVAEAVVLRAVIFGLLCDFLPHISDALFVSITGDTPFRYVGPFSRVVMAADLLLNSTTNWMIFKRIKKRTTKLKANVNID